MSGHNQSTQTGSDAPKPHDSPRKDGVSMRSAASRSYSLEVPTLLTPGDVAVWLPQLARRSTP
jgi:hypothetical protein